MEWNSSSREGLKTHGVGASHRIQIVNLARAVKRDAHALGLEPPLKLPVEEFGERVGGMNTALERHQFHHHVLTTSFLVLAVGVIGCSIAAALRRFFRRSSTTIKARITLNAIPDTRSRFAPLELTEAAGAFS